MLHFAVSLPSCSPSSHLPLDFLTRVPRGYPGTGRAAGNVPGVCTRAASTVLAKHSLDCSTSSRSYTTKLGRDPVCLRRLLFTPRSRPWSPPPLPPHPSLYPPSLSPSSGGDCGANRPAEAWLPSSSPRGPPSLGLANSPPSVCRRRTPSPGGLLPERKSSLSFCPCPLPEHGWPFREALLMLFPPPLVLWLQSLILTSRVTRIFDQFCMFSLPRAPVGRSEAFGIPGPRLEPEEGGAETTHAHRDRGVPSRGQVPQDWGTQCGSNLGCSQAGLLTAWGRLLTVVRLLRFLC